MNFFKSKTNIILTAVIVALAITCGVLAFNINSYSNTLNDVSEQINNNASNNSMLSSEICELNSINSSLKSEIDNYASQNSSLSSENSELKEENSDLKNENDSLKDKLTSSITKPQGSNTPTDQSNNTPTEQGKICYLTFDDGPSDNTLKILDILAEYNAKATFFVIGASKTEYIKNIHDAGHAIGLHSKSHDYKKIYASEEAFFEDLNSISAIVEQKTGVKPTITRFPGGSSNTVSKFNKGIMTRLSSLLPEKGYAYFDWNISSGDAQSKPLNSEEIANTVINQAKNKDLICVLFHDAAAKKATVQALPTILERLKGMGFEFKALTNDSYGFHHGINN